MARIYQRYDQDTEMTEAWRLLGARLELLTSANADNVVPMTGRDTHKTAA